MNDIKKIVGLLNNQAPKGEFLAYINPKEANVLKQMGGAGKMTPQGILSFAEDYGSFDSYGGMSSGYSGDYEGDAYGTTSAADYGYDFGDPDPNVGASNNNFTYDDSQDDDKALSYVNFNQPTTVTDSSNDSDTNTLRTVLDVVTLPFSIAKEKYGTAVNSLKNLLNLGTGDNANKYAGITGEDGLGEGDFVYDDIRDFAKDTYNIDYETLDNEGQREIDLQAFNDGFRTSDFRNLYSGDTDLTNKNFTSTESDNIAKAIEVAPFVIGNTEAPKSMVNEYFANLENQEGLSQGLLDRYNTAKTNVTNTLGLVANTNQFGYSANPNSPFTTNNRTGNPFYIDYMITRGLI